MSNRNFTKSVRPKCWCTPTIPALWKLKQKDYEFEARLGYITKSHLKKKREEDKERNSTKSKSD
jgi:hypothetical protein